MSSTNDDKLIQILSEVPVALPVEMRKLYESKAGIKPTGEIWSAIVQLSRALHPMLISDSRFGLSEKMIRTGNNGGSLFDLGISLLQMLFKTNSPTAAVSWLEKTVSLQEAESYSVFPLYGLPQNCRFTIDKNIQVIPFKEIPAGGYKDWMLSLYEGQPLKTAVKSGLTYSTPHTAILIRQMVRPLWLDDSSKSQIPNAYHVEENAKIASNVALALTLVGPRITVVNSQGSVFNDPDLEFCVLGSSSSARLMDILPAKPIVEPPVDKVFAAELVKKFLEFPKKPSLKIAVAATRLNRALQRESIGDSFIELGIALEALLGDGNNGVSHKLAVRASFLLGKDPDEKIRTFRTSKKIYKHRSDMVHTGSLSLKPEELKTDFEDGSLLICNLAQKILEIGKIPDWERVDLGILDWEKP